MNVFAHVAVAARAARGADAEPFLLGAALSDLASFGGFRLLGRSPDPEVRAGMAFHHRSDDAFHAHPWFRGRNRGAAAALEAGGLGRGAARACAHVGIEMLLDGSLHPSPADRERFRRTLEVTDRLLPALEPLVDEARRPSWVAHLHRVGSAGRLPPYDRVDVVAGRLHAICARRPRLAFDHDAVEDVAGVLASLAPGITASGPELVEGLARDLAPTLEPSPRR